MLKSIRRLGYRLIKPRSSYLSHSDPDFPRKRIVDAEHGKYDGVPYRIEQIVTEDLTPDYDRETYIKLLLAKDAREKRKIIEEMERDPIQSAQNAVRRIGIVNHILTRPSYNEMGEIYLILEGIVLDPLPYRRQKSNGLGDYRTDHEGTSYEIFLKALAEESFRKIAEEEVKKNKKDPNMHKPGYDWHLSVDKLMLSKIRDFDKHRFIVSGEKIIPALPVKDFDHGHIAARDCIDFAFTWGKDILEDRICFVRHRPHFIYRMDREAYRNQTHA